MEMSAALQVVLFIASVLFILLAVCMMPIAFLAWRQLAHLAIAAGQMKADLYLLLQESREMVRNVNDLSKRANQQMDDVNKVVHIVEHWTERVDRIANEVSLAIEPPVLTVVRNMNLVRAGLSVFLRVLAHSGQSKLEGKEKKHV
jgi:uncharacterized protein YoxC